MRILTFNMQAGIGTQSARDLILGAHRQVFLTRKKTKNLEKIGAFIKDFDIVCLQEVGLGGRRSGFESQLLRLREISGLPHVTSQVNRRIGKVSVHGNAVLSRFPITNIRDLKLPSRIPGRGKMICEVDGICIVNTHLSLDIATQAQQLNFIKNELEGQENLVICGDLNLQAHAPHLVDFATKMELSISTGFHTRSYPAWAPRRDLDHILVSHALGHGKAHVYHNNLSDHLPVSLTLK